MKCEKCFGNEDGVHLVRSPGGLPFWACAPCRRACGAHVATTEAYSNWVGASRELEYFVECARAGSRPERAAWMMWQDKHFAALGELREISERWLAEDKPAEPELPKGDPGAVLVNAVCEWGNMPRGIKGDVALLLALGEYVAAEA
ncbi:hypothetical protein LCGC14_1604660 [marine sediment metagenome]|uniref:Uncharacterized protein n=1 Tax=marine sediment metagenome TaxID=412755 RepID=A0A0F9IA32_9ZZZZ